MPDKQSAAPTLNSLGTRLTWKEGNSGNSSPVGGVPAAEDDAVPESPDAAPESPEAVAVPGENEADVADDPAAMPATSPVQISPPAGAAPEPQRAVMISPGP